MHLRLLTIIVSVMFTFTGGDTRAFDEDAILEHANDPWTGDLDGMTERGFVRILTVHNPLFFSFDGASKRGMFAELGKLFEDHLADEIGRVRSPTVVLIPVRRDELIPGLISGRGDMVMGNLTITPERQKKVDFGPPIHNDVEELIVTGPAAPGVETFDDLVEIGLYVRRSSSYFEHLQALNAKRQSVGKAPIPIREGDENLEDYDLLDMVNAGILGAIVVDSHKANFWEQVFDRIEVQRDLAVNTGSQIAWALRKDSPQLKASITAFADSVKKGSLLGNIILQRYLGNTEWLDDGLSDENRRRNEEIIEMIKRFSDQYNFDWLMITALAYQESRFDQNKESSAGAVGVMQLLPQTAADDAVGIPDISSLENNIHAGIKYLHWLRETYFSDPQISALDQVLFSLAAYNAGPGNMNRARQRARRLGYDHNRWFGNVEIGMFRAVSGEPASYVRNIYKYYVTYRGFERTRRERETALEAKSEDAKDSSLNSTLYFVMIAGLVVSLLVIMMIRKQRSE